MCRGGGSPHLMYDNLTHVGMVQGQSVDHNKGKEVMPKAHGPVSRPKRVLALGATTGRKEGDILKKIVGSDIYEEEEERQGSRCGHAEINSGGIGGCQC